MRCGVCTPDLSAIECYQQFDGPAEAMVTPARKSRIKGQSCQHAVTTLYIQETRESFVKLVHYLTGALLRLKGTCFGLFRQFESGNCYQPGSILLTIMSINASPIRSTCCGLMPRAPQSDGELTTGS